MRIVQITSDHGRVFGLCSEGNLYELAHQGSGHLYRSCWNLYCKSSDIYDENYDKKIDEIRQQTPVVIIEDVPF